MSNYKSIFGNLSRRNKIALTMGLGLGLVTFGYFRLVRSGYIFPLELWSEVFCTNCTNILPYHVPIEDSTLINRDRNLAELLGNNIDKNQISILIEKSKYRLTIYDRRQAIKAYSVVFGENPQGDKLKAGDMRTPEGIFYLRDLYPHPQWSKFLWLDYPTANSWRKHLKAKKEGKIPWYSSIGSEVGIHGVPANSDRSIDLKFNWTWGCISLKNADIDEIYRFTQAKTLVEILP
jgi:L,D-transpeptidase catalytic domain